MATFAGIVAMGLLFAVALLFLLDTHERTKRAQASREEWQEIADAAGSDDPEVRRDAAQWFAEKTRNARNGGTYYRTRPKK